MLKYLIDNKTCNQAAQTSMHICMYKTTKNNFQIFGGGKLLIYLVGWDKPGNKRPVRVWLHNLTEDRETLL